jgi:hypothetical protein
LCRVERVVVRGKELRDLCHGVAAPGAQVPAVGARRLHQEDVRVADVLDVRQWEAPEPGVHGGEQRVELRVTCSSDDTSACEPTGSLGTTLVRLRGKVNHLLRGTSGAGRL